MEEGRTVASASGAAGCSERTGFKWLARCRAGGEAALADRCLGDLAMPPSPAYGRRESGGKLVV